MAKKKTESVTSTKKGRSQSRDALYLRELRARKAVLSAVEAGESRSVLSKLRKVHRDAVAEYLDWKRDQGLIAELKLRPRREEGE